MPNLPNVGAAYIAITTVLIGNSFAEEFVKPLLLIDFSLLYKKLSFSSLVENQETPPS